MTFPPKPTSESEQFHIEKLDLKSHDRSQFESGSEPLDKWFHNQAGQQMRSHASVVFVLVTDSNSGKIAGFYTLSASTISASDMPPKIIRKLKLPRYPALPTLLFGRLAVDKDFHGRGFGKALLADAVQKTIKLIDELGAIALTVDAKDDSARTFYQRFGFVSFETNQDRLFLPVATLLDLQ